MTRRSQIATAANTNQIFIKIFWMSKQYLDASNNRKRRQDADNTDNLSVWNGALCEHSEWDCEHSGHEAINKKSKSKTPVKHKLIGIIGSAFWQSKNFVTFPRSGKRIRLNHIGQFSSNLSLPVKRQTLNFKLINESPLGHQTVWEVF